MRFFAAGCLSKVFQFTHPGGVRLFYYSLNGIASEVSIHAPGRGATRQHHHVDGVRPVSIHAPGRGATYIIGGHIWVLGVSIHAPGRGATCAQY